MKNNNFFNDKTQILNRIYVCIDMAFLFMGIFMLFISAYPPICGNEQNITRAVIGSVCIDIWFIMFPAISPEVKDKVTTAIGIHALFSFLSVIIVIFEIHYLMNNKASGRIGFDILFCFGGVIVITYLFYVFVAFIKTFFYLLEKAIKFIFPKLKEHSGLIKVIEAITTAILSITAFGASIIGAITLVKQFLEIFKN